MRRPARSDFAKKARAARRHAANVAAVDERDIGIRPNMGALLGFGEETFHQKAHRWLTRTPF